MPTMELKFYDAEVKAFDDEKLRITHFISTEHKDRHGDIVRAKGMKIKGRPVVLLGHGRDHMGREPIAKPLWVKPGTFKGNDGVEAETQFFPDDVGRRLYQKNKEGYMPNWSIGFLSIKEEPLKGQTGPFAGRDIQEWELLEYSLVGVSANPNAQTPKGVSELQFKMFDEVPGELVTRQVKGLCEECGIVEGLYTLKGQTAVRNECPKCGKFGKDDDIQPPPEEEKGNEADPSEGSEEPDSEKAVIPYKKTPLAPEGDAWSGPGEVEKATPAELKVMCVWYDSAKPDLKGSYKGPHHRAGGDHSCVWNGVRALAGVLMGARGGIKIPEGDVAAVRSHVEKHYKDFDKGNPPWKGKKGELFLDTIRAIREEDGDDADESLIHLLSLYLIPEYADFFAPDDDGKGDETSKILSDIRAEIESIKAQISKNAGTDPPAAEPGAADGDGDPPPVENPPEPAKGPKRLVFREDEEEGEEKPNPNLAAVALVVRQALEKKAQTEIDRLTGKVR